WRGPWIVWFAAWWAGPGTGRRRRRPSRCRSRLLVEAAVPLDLIQNLAVLDLPGGGPFLEVLDPAADLFVQLLVDLHVLLEDVAHPLPQHGVRDEDLGDVRRLHERLDHLVRHPLETVLAEA